MNVSMCDLFRLIAKIKSVFGATCMSCVVMKLNWAVGIRLIWPRSGDNTRNMADMLPLIVTIAYTCFDEMQCLLALFLCASAPYILVLFLYGQVTPTAPLLRYLWPYIDQDRALTATWRKWIRELNKLLKLIRELTGSDCVNTLSKHTVGVRLGFL